MYEFGFRGAPWFTPVTLLETFHGTQFNEHSGKCHLFLLSSSETVMTLKAHGTAWKGHNHGPTQLGRSFPNLDEHLPAMDEQIPVKMVNGQ